MSVTARLVLELQGVSRAVHSAVPRGPGDPQGHQEKSHRAVPAGGNQGREA